MKKSLMSVGAIAALALLAGCGSSSSTSSSASAPATTAAATTAATTPASTTAASGAAGGAPGTLVVTTKHDKLGTILAAGPKRLTVYLFEADKGAASTCSGACATVWPPVTTADVGKVAGKAIAADLGTTTRSDGTKQITYKGHPLYFYAKDKDDGDTYGEGSKSFGAGWYVLKPNGSKVDNDDGDDGDDNDS